ncbi:hypothetical protein H1R20_g12596, partial [Candolleomyces eurysporus]
MGNPESAYQDAAVVSALAAGIAAQLYGFSDPKNYLRTYDQKKIDNSKGKYPENFSTASFCYFAVGVNLVAAVDAFVVKDWKAQDAAGGRGFRKLADHLVFQGS